MPNEINRRSFLGTIGATVGGIALGSSSSTAQTLDTTASAGSCDLDSVGPLVFNETSSLLDSNYGRLTDEDIVFVFSEDTASAGEYSNEAVPLWARDGNYFGSGSLLVNDDEDNCLDYGQDAVLLNIIDSYTGGSGHIVYDESADQDYTLTGHFSKLEQWVTDEGYTIEASTDLTASLDGADALLVTLPDEEHAADQIDAITSFAANGNPVFLFNEGDSWDTDDLNYLADQLDLAFRFDDDEVTDEPGWDWDDWPVTSNYDDETYPGWFEYRPSMGFDPGEEYQAQIVEIIDGDTFDIEHVGGFHDGEEDRVRHLGQDTAETGRTQNDSDEWRGIEDENHLDTWGSNATDYAEANFDVGDRITFWVDEAEHPPRGTYGRLLAMHTYPEGHELADVNYNFDVVEKGYAKPYNSAFIDHPEFVEAYWDAYENDRRIWEEADAEATGEVWNDDVETLRFRGATTIGTDNGSLDDDRTAVWSDSNDPVVGVDENNRIALVGGLMNADNWEGSDDENFVFNANLAQKLSGNVADEMLLIEGGHGQFEASYDFSFEGKEAYHRFIEGLDAMWFQAVNELSGEWLDTVQGRHALVITPPAPDFCYTAGEIDALQSYLADGGAVVLKANTEVDSRSVETLNDLAAELGTDLRFGDDSLGNVETSSFNETFDLFGAYVPGDHDDEDQPASFDVAIDAYDQEVTAGETITVEYTVQNSGDEEETQDIVFSVDGAQEDIEEGVTLDGGATFSDAFTYTTEADDTPEVVVEVATDDDSEERTVTVNDEDGDDPADVLEADPNTEETASYHTWTLADPANDFDGEVNEITVSYPSGTSLDGLTDEDVTVYMDRDGDGTTDEISVNSGEYTGSEATFDLDGRFNTSVEGEVRVEIDGVLNPEAGDYIATITLDGDDVHSVDAAFVIESDGTGKESVSVETVGATNIGETSATLTGDLTELENADEALVYFEYGESGGTLPNTTTEQVLNSTGTFDDEVTDLEADTEYEFRALAETEEDLDTGGTVSFTTDQADDGEPSEPVIDSFDLTDVSNPQWARVETDWAVSDADGNLEEVTSVLNDGADSETSTVSGSSASGTHELRERQGYGEAEVTLTVTDTDGNETSQTKTIDLS